MRTKVTIPVLLIIWLIIGAIAAAQRGYFSESDVNCNEAGSTIVTILLGPLNYIGVNPTVNCPEAPEPSE